MFNPGVSIPQGRVASGGERGSVPRAWYAPRVVGVRGAGSLAMPSDGYLPTYITKLGAIADICLKTFPPNNFPSRRMGPGRDAEPLPPAPSPAADAGRRQSADAGVASAVRGARGGPAMCEAYVLNPPVNGDKAQGAETAVQGRSPGSRPRVRDHGSQSRGCARAQGLFSPWT